LLICLFFAQIGDLCTTLHELRANDLVWVRQAIPLLEMCANFVSVGGSAVLIDERGHIAVGEGRMRWAQTMRRWADVDLNLWFELLMALLLARGGDETLKRLNPFLTDDYVRMVTDITAGIAFRSSRVSQLLRCEDLGDNLAARLRRGADAGGVHADVLVEELYIEAMKLADVLGTSRHFTTAEYVGSAGNTVTFDPRLLFFEFAHDIVLRKSQVELIEKFKRTIAAGESMCHQMIMGAGKTTGGCSFFFSFFFFCSFSHSFSHFFFLILFLYQWWDRSWRSCSPTGARSSCRSSRSRCWKCRAACCDRSSPPSCASRFTR
jgi:hypothetical protein